MDIKRLILTGCSVVVLSAGTALAGPCDTTGRTANLKDAGSGPTSQSTSQTVGVGNDSKEHPPTSTMNRASGDVAASSQDSAAADAGTTDRRATGPRRQAWCRDGYGGSAEADARSALQCDAAKRH